VSDESGQGVGRAFAAYSALRFVLFTVVVAVLYLFGLDEPLPLLGTSVLLSAVLSYVVLRPQREELARRIAGRDSARREEREALRARLEDSP
jgi:membrane associated rhomboid family serine protease